MCKKHILSDPGKAGCGPSSTNALLWGHPVGHPVANYWMECCQGLFAFSNLPYWSLSESGNGSHCLRTSFSLKLGIFYFGWLRLGFSLQFWVGWLILSAPEKGMFVLKPCWPEMHQSAASFISISVLYLCFSMSPYSFTGVLTFKFTVTQLLEWAKSTFPVKSSLLAPLITMSCD